jgi:hypothetical protein
MPWLWARSIISGLCGIICDTFIYPILDWGGQPGLTIGMILAGQFIFFWSQLGHECWRLIFWSLCSCVIIIAMIGVQVSFVPGLCHVMIAERSIVSGLCGIICETFIYLILDWSGLSRLAIQNDLCSTIFFCYLSYHDCWRSVFCPLVVLTAAGQFSIDSVYRSLWVLHVTGAVWWSLSSGCRDFCRSAFWSLSSFLVTIAEG